MATRVNTKFVVILATVLVILVGGGVFAVMRLTKGAEDYAADAESKIIQAKQLHEQGKIEEGNTLLDKAAKGFYQAKTEDPDNIAYLYRFIDAHNLVVCSDLTLAYNELDAELFGAESIHDTPSASYKDRSFLYELLHERYRMGVVVRSRSAKSYIYNYARKWLDNHPGDPLAMRNLALVEVGRVEQSSISSEERSEILARLTQSIETSPDDPWLRNAAGLFHIADARRQYRDSGSAFTDEVNAAFYRAFEELKRAVSKAKDEPAPLVETLRLMMSLRSQDESVTPEMIGERIETTRMVHELLKDKEKRDKLFTVELADTVQMIGMLGTGIEGHEFDGQQYALDLAAAVVKDRPDDPAAHAMLGRIYRERGMLEEAEQTIEAGLKALAAHKMPNGLQFVQDVQSRLEMLSTLTEVKIYLAQNAITEDNDEELQKQLLVEAGKLVQQLADAPTPQQEWRDARAQYLRGRIDYVYNRPRQAILRFEKANEYYKDRDRELLQFLAETHRKLGNDGKVIESYEKLVELNPMSPVRLNLIHGYLSQKEDKYLARAEFHLNNFLGQFPNNLAAIRLKANLLVLQDKAEEARALLLQQDLEKHPELNDHIADIELKLGNVDKALAILREQIFNRPEGTAMNLNVVTRLIAIIPERDQKLKQLQELVDDGLDTKVAAIYRKYIENGQLVLEDELALLEAQAKSSTPGAVALGKFLIYQRWGKEELAREQLDRAIQLEPMLPAVVEWRFRIALQEEQWDNAEIAINDMLKLDLDDRPEIAIGDGAFMRAQMIATQAISMERGPARDKRLREAASEYSEALKKYGHYANGWVQLGRVQLIQDNHFGAQESLREALARQSRNVTAIELMARAEIATGDQPQALERFEQILRIQPNHPTALNQFTALAQNLGVPGRAIRQRELIAESIPSNTDNRRQLALLYAADQAYDRAKLAIDQVIDLEGKTRANLAVLSRVLVLGEKSDQAIKEVQSYLTRLGKDAEWQDHLLMAQTYEWSKQPEEANTAFQKAIELEDPKEVPATLAWANALLDRGEAAKAAKIYEDLSNQHKDKENLKLQAAKVWLAAKEYTKAESIALNLSESPDRYRLLIQSAIGQNKLGIAIDRVRAGVKTFPSDLTLRLQLGGLLLTTQQRRPEDNRDYSETTRVVEDLLRDHPDRVEVQLLVADVYLATERYAEAIAQIEQILEFAPTHIPANERLYKIKMNEAKILQQTSVEASQTKAAEALGIVALLIKSRPEISSLYRFAGEAADLAGQTEQSVGYYRKAFEMTGEEKDLASYALALLVTERGADARSILEDPKHVSMVTQNLFLRALRGRALAAVGQDDMATALFQNALRESKEVNAQLVLVRQISLAFKQTPQRAVEIIEGVLGENLPVAIDAALAELMISEKKYAEAAARLAKYEENPVGNPAVQFSLLSQLAVARQESDQLPKAKATYEKARELMMQNTKLIPMRRRVHLLNNLAYLLADRMAGYEDDAVKYAREALKQLPPTEAEENVALIEDTLGWALFKAGRYEEAIKVLTSSVNKYELSANLLHLGRAYLADGKTDKATLFLDKARTRARIDKDEKMIEETNKWYQTADR